jgi:hypothetical protein
LPRNDRARTWRHGGGKFAETNASIICHLPISKTQNLLSTIMTAPKLLSALLVLLILCCTSVQSFQANNQRFPTRRPSVATETSSYLFNVKTQTSTENGLDTDYPWTFTGRLWFRPALVRVPSGPNDPRPPPSVSILNLFGWTLGGSVALEYDDSPVGPYREYVQMGAAVFKRGSFGQWGSKLYVSTKAAEDVCRKTWSVPAAFANIEFSEDSSSTLKVESAPDIIAPEKQSIKVGGWKNSRILKEPEDISKRYPPSGLPALWTPSIKALWTPFIALPSSEEDDSQLPVHRLRLSASAIRLSLCGQRPSDALGIPMPIGLLVDNVLIEISREEDEPL